MFSTNLNPFPVNYRKYGKSNKSTIIIDQYVFIVNMSGALITGDWPHKYVIYVFVYVFHCNFTRQINISDYRDFEAGNQVTMSHLPTLSC